MQKPAIVIARKGPGLGNTQLGWKKKKGKERPAKKEALEGKRSSVRFMSSSTIKIWRLVNFIHRNGARRNRRPPSGTRSIQSPFITGLKGRSNTKRWLLRSLLVKYLLANAEEEGKR